MFGVRINGIAENDHLDNGNANHHGQSHAIAAHLDKLLGDNGKETSKGKKIACRHKLMLLIVLHQTDKNIFHSLHQLDIAQVATVNLKAMIVNIDVLIVIFGYQLKDMMNFWRN